MTLSDTQLETFRKIAGRIIPAEDGVLGADDLTIFADISSTLNDIAPAIAKVVETVTLESPGGFENLAPEAQDAVLQRAQASLGMTFWAAVQRVTLCYYRDERVLSALGLRPGPPFPRGQALEQGDWSLLDPVKARQPFWRGA